MKSHGQPDIYRRIIWDSNSRALQTSPLKLIQILVFPTRTHHCGNAPLDDDEDRRRSSAGGDRVLPATSYRRHDQSRLQSMGHGDHTPCYSLSLYIYLLLWTPSGGGHRPSAGLIS